MSEFQFGGDVVWRPSDEIVTQSRLKQFMDRHGIARLEELLRRSTEDIEWFWTAVLQELGIEFYQPYERILDTSRGIAWPRWCFGGKLNIVHNCLDKWIGTAVASRIAIRWEGEKGESRDLTYAELYREVSRLANALRALGVRKGDVAALFMPMCRKGRGVFCHDQARRHRPAAVLRLRRRGGGRVCGTPRRRCCLPPTDSADEGRRVP